MTIDYLFALAIQLSGLTPPIDTPPPHIVEVTPYEMNALVCDNQCAGSFLGMFRPFNPDTVFVLAGISTTPTIDARSVLIHEFTHYLQYKSGHMQREITCKDRVASELEALAVEERFYTYFDAPIPDFTSSRLYYLSQCTGAN